jgi:ribosomal protein S18
MLRIFTRGNATKIDYESIKFHKQIQPKSFYQPRNLNEQTKFQLFQPQKPNLAHVSKEYTNTLLLSSFMNRTGMILPRAQTGLSPKDQQMVAKMIKRARQFGLIPFTYKPHH